jgi:transcriptional regulator GlxA family with amidase domain
VNPRNLRKKSESFLKELEKSHVSIDREAWCAAMTPVQALEIINSRLNQIQNWPELARQAKWCVATLAKNCGVSVRTLERHFEEKMGKPPKAYLTEQRQQLARQLLLENKASLKELASQLEYKSPCNFYRDFKEHWGIYPAQINQSRVET